MMTHRKITYWIVCILVAAIFVYEYRKFQSNITPLETESNDSAVSNANLTGASVQTASPVADSSSPPAIQVSSPKAFPSWFADEAKNLESKSADPQEKEAELKDRASRFSAEEISFLSKTATNPKASANERIEATYLLTLSSSTNSLLEISKTPLSLPSPQPVHSIGETLLMQEKAIRIMAIDELFNRAKDNAALRANLLQVINQIQDEAVKHYALKRYKEFK